MVDRNFTVGMKKDIILDFMKEKGNSGFSQGELAQNLMGDLCYVSETSAKVSISKMLIEMEEEGKVFYKEIKPKRGRLPMKVWYLTDQEHPIQAQ